MKKIGSMLLILSGGNSVGIGLVLWYKCLVANRVADTVANDPLVIWMALSQGSTSMMAGVLIIVAAWTMRHE